MIVLLKLNDKEFNFFVYDGVIGLLVIDVCKFYGDFGLFIFDLGFILMVSCEFVIIYIDGDEGVFFYCGYLID